MTLLEAIARQLDTWGLVTIGTDVFLENLPDEPVDIVSLWGYDGGESNLRLNLDYPNLQVRTRALDPDTCRQRLEGIWAKLHGFTGTLEGDWVIELCAGRQPTSLGIDEKGQAHTASNFRLLVRNPVDTGRED